MQGCCVHRVLREGPWRLGLAKAAVPQPAYSTWRPEGRAQCVEAPAPSPPGQCDGLEHPSPSQLLWLPCLLGQTWSQRSPWSGWAGWRAGELLGRTLGRLLLLLANPRWPAAPGEPLSSQGPGLQGGVPYSCNLCVYTLTGPQLLWSSRPTARSGVFACILGA